MIQPNHNPSAYFNIFKVSLTRQQQKVLNSLLPRNHSFQPFKCTRSIDQESLKSQHVKTTKKKLYKQYQKDPDYSISYPSAPKQLSTVKIQSNTAIPGGEQFMLCYLILRKLKKSMYAWPFKVPVDPASLVLQPMDLRTIEDNLRKEAYKHDGQFHRDIYKMLMNSYKFNQKNSDVFHTTSEFQEEYLKVVKEAKQGKLTLVAEKKVKLENNPLQQMSSLGRQKLSEVQIKVKNPGTSIKKQKKQKIKQKVMVDFQKQPQKNNKPKDKFLKLVEQNFLQKQKVKIQEKAVDIQKQKFKNGQKAIKKQADETFLFKRFEGRKQQIQQQLPLLKATKSLINKQEQSYNIQQQNAKKGKIKKQKSCVKDKNSEMSDTILELKEFKEVTQVENEKNIVFSAIQKRLADLLKKLNEYQIPKNKQKFTNKNIEGAFELPILNAATAITNPEKRKLAEKINMLPSQQLRYVIEICFRNKRNKTKDQEGVYQIDLDKLDGKTLKELSNFVAIKTKTTKKFNQSRAQSKAALSNADNLDQNESQEDIFDEQFKIDEDYEAIGAEENNDPLQKQIEVENMMNDESIQSIHSANINQPLFHYLQQEMIEVPEHDQHSNSLQYDQNHQFHF